MIYLDYNATTPCRPEAQDTLVSLLQQGATNPSSVHQSGRRARMSLEHSRSQLAKIIKCKPSSIFFTSGGTEANHLALHQVPPQTSIFISQIEHPSLFKAAAHTAQNQGGSCTSIPVDDQGLIDLKALEDLLAPTKNPFVSCMLANNETGVIQDIHAIAQRVHAKDGLLHVDASQALGKIPFSFEDLEIDLLTVSSHKCGGPQGAGALVTKPSLNVTPLFLGGGQERQKRSGTEPVALIGAFAKGARTAQDEIEAGKGEILRTWHNNLEKRLKEASPRIHIFSEDAPRLPNTTALCFPPLKAETQVMLLDLEGFCISAGSACSSGKTSLSPVITALCQHDPQGGIKAASTIRISSGWGTTEDEMLAFEKAYLNIIENA